jgi:hypothetical protein
MKPYKMTRPTKKLEYELFSSEQARKKDSDIVDGAMCWGRGRLTFDQLSEVEAAQFRTELLIDPATGKTIEKRYISLAKMRQALLWAWLCDSRAGSNWTDEDEVALDHRPAVLNEYVHPTDLAILGNKLMREFFPEYFGSDEEPEAESDSDEELDEEGRAADGRKRKVNPTSDSGKTAETN